MGWKCCFDNTDAKVLVLRKLFLNHWKQGFFLEYVILNYDYLPALPVWMLSSLMCLVWCQPTRFAVFALASGSFHCCPLKMNASAGLAAPGNEGLSACLYSLFLTAWPSPSASSMWRGFSQTKAEVIPPGSEIRLFPGKSALVPQPAGAGGVHEGVEEKVQVDTDSVLLSAMSKTSSGCAESPAKTVEPATWVPAFCNMGLRMSFVPQAAVGRGQRRWYPRPMARTSTGALCTWMPTSRH